MNKWTDLLTADQLYLFHADVAKLDPNFARKQRDFYESRTAPQLDALASQAWLCNEGESYQLAKSYRALAA